MKPADLIINGEIVLDGQIVGSMYEDYFESGIITANLVRRALAMFEGDVTVKVNSTGGDPTEGEAIREAFRTHAGKVTVVVTGDAMSAASLMIMGAARIEMSRGSIMMIHDPSTIAIGTSSDLRHAANYLDVLADTYADVYAARAGMSAEDVRALMVDELYMGPAEAISRGFADGLAGSVSATLPEPSLSGARMEEAQGRFQQSKAGIADLMAKIPNHDPITAGDPHQASMAAEKEAPMPQNANPAVETPNPEITMAAQPPVATPDPAPRVDADAIRMEERNRQRDIRKMAAPFMASGMLPEADVDAAIDAGLTPQAASQRFMAAMEAQAAPVSRNARTEITRDETDTRLEGMIGALMGERTGPAESFKGLKLKSLALELAGPRKNFHEAQEVRRGMTSVTMMGGAHGVSDFAFITTEVMNRSLISEYERRGANWSVVTGTPLSASDFRELAPVRFGGDFQLKTVLENGEYQEATLKDEAEGLKVERRGRTINLTFEAVINDDMGAFQRIPREFAMAARVMESSMVWGLIRSNAVLKSDSTALFHTANHKNLAASGGAISATTIGAARKAMWEQTAFGGKDADDFLMIDPDTLIVPAALELVALQFKAGTVPTKDGDSNPFKATLNPVVVPHLGAAAGGSDTAWYLVSSDLPPISVAYLDGYEAPSVQTIEGMNPDKVTMNARHIFGAAAVEYRGAYKNPGA